jgi:hypothetical protein
MAQKGVVSGNNYTFNALAKTITFSNDYLGMALSDVMYIINITSGVATVIYDPSDITKGGTLSGLTLTLNYDTSSMSSTDSLQIIIGFTPQNQDPAPVKSVDTVTDTNQTELLQSIADNLGLLSLAMDVNEKAPLSVHDVVTKKDVQGANVISDAPRPLHGILKGAVLGDSFVVDTTGYATLVVQCASSVGYNSQIIIEGCNDAPNFASAQWSQLTYINTINTTTGATAIQNANFSPTPSNSYTLYISCFHRFIRIRPVTASAGTFSITAYLRTQPVDAGPIFTKAVSATIGAISTIVATQNAAGSTQNFTGGLPVGGFLPPGSTNVTWPVLVGGRELPAVGSLSGVSRTLLVDPLGRPILGTDIPSGSFGNGSTMRGVGGIQNTIQGSQALLVSDVGQTEGNTNNHLLYQILEELKILNQQFIELPILLQSSFSQMSDPDEYRNEHGKNW